MYRNFNAVALGITGRQSELIELALTFGFGGLDLDMAGIAKRARAGNIEQACRFMASAGIKGSEFDLPIDLGAAETIFRSGLVELGEVAQIAASLQANCCRVTITAVSEAMPYQENFELHRSRLAAVSEVLASHNIRMGLAFSAAASHRVEAESAFIHTGEALLTLLRTIGDPNVGLALDTWNWFVGGGSLEDLLAIPAETIVSVRLADIRSDADLATIADQERYMPGDGGLINCHAIVQHLIGSGYSGPLTLYPDPARFVGMTRDSIVQQAKATLNDLYNPTPPTPVEAAPVEAAPVEAAPVEADTAEPLSSEPLSSEPLSSEQGEASKAGEAVAAAEPVEANVAAE